MDFEKQLKKLEEMNQKISTGELGLKESLETFKEGLKIISACKKELQEAEESVKKWTGFDEQTGEAQFEDF